MTRTDIINNIIKENNYVSYLEIGLGNCTNFVHIDVLHKIGVDPAVKNTKITLAVTSDEFFATNKQKFDLIFIDGLHEAPQAEKDMMNAWGCLNDSGAMILHDVCPFSREMCEVPRIQIQWTGDVYKAAIGFIQAHPQIPVKYFPETYGLLLILKTKNKLKSKFVNESLSYEEFVKLKEKLYVP